VDTDVEAMGGCKWRVLCGSKSLTLIVAGKPKDGTDGRLCDGNEVIVMLLFPFEELLLKRRAGR
jgi:hypothetical protein